MGICSECVKERDRRRRIDHPDRCKDCKRERASGRVRCHVCLERLRRKYHERIANGQCEVCGEPAITRIFCREHWFKNIGRSHSLTKRNGGLGMIAQLWEEQQGRCAVTGDILTPGVDASLDHIIPVSRGGPSTKTNLRWVLLEINHCKWDLTHEEFVQVCRKVIAATDSQKEERAVTLQLVGRS